MVPTQDTLFAIVSTGLGAKLISIAIRTMPPPPGTCGFWCRWFYDFLQQYGDNTDQIGSKRNPKDAASNSIVEARKPADITNPEAAKPAEITK